MSVGRCQQCNKSFRAWCDYKKHVNEAHPVKPPLPAYMFRCLVCAFKLVLRNCTLLLCRHTRSYCWCLQTCKLPYLNARVLAAGACYATR